MKTGIGVFVLALVGSMPAAQGASRPSIGAPAPPFTLTDDGGHSRSLAENKGKVVVLEWHSPECPYVGKYYKSGRMQELQRQWTSKGVIWFTIESAGPGQTGFVTPEQSIAYSRANGAAPTAVLLDPTGEVGHGYGAKTSLHMAVIDRKGQLAYLGGIDDYPSTDPADLAHATNFVAKALGEVMDGRPVSTPSTAPYGCQIFYAK